MHVVFYGIHPFGYSVTIYKEGDRYKCNSGRDKYEWVGIEMLSEYIRAFKITVLQPDDEYRIRIDQFMRREFSEEEWALAVLTTM